MRGRSIKFQNHKITNTRAKLQKPVSISLLLCFYLHSRRKSLCEKSHYKNRKKIQLQIFLQNFKEQFKSRYYYARTDDAQENLPVRGRSTKLQKYKQSCKTSKTIFSP